MLVEHHFWCGGRGLFLMLQTKAPYGLGVVLLLKVTCRQELGYLSSNLSIPPPLIKIELWGEVREAK